MRHYEIVLLVHPDQSEQVPAMVDRYKGMISAGGGQVHRFRGLGPAPADVPDLQGPQSALCPAEHRDAIRRRLDELNGSFRFSDAVLRTWS
jgi:small subunit ribosomal protein S6